MSSSTEQRYQQHGGGVTAASGLLTLPAGSAPSAVASGGHLKQTSPRRRPSLVSHMEVVAAKVGSGSCDESRSTSHATAAKTAASPAPVLEAKIPSFLNHIPKCYNVSGGERSETRRLLAEHQKFYREVHPAVGRVGVLMRHRKIVGSNSRAVAMLNAFVRFFEDYTPVAFKPIEKHLEAELNRQFNFLTQCRPHNMAMGNALRFLKSKLQTANDLGSDELIQALTVAASHFIQEKIVSASWTIAMLTARDYIKNGDHIVIYGNSTAVGLAILSARKLYEKSFRVTVIDGHTSLEAKDFVVELQRAGIEVAYILLQSAAAFIPDCDKVLLGAAAVMSNGCVTNRIGCASVAALARSDQKPVYILAECYKLTARGISSAFAHNILDDPRILLGGTENSLKLSAQINPINLVYDIIDQRDFVGLISEEGFTAAADIPRQCALRFGLMDGR